MKRNILLTMILLLAATGMQAQVLVKHGENKENLEFGNDKLVKMVFDSYGANNGDNIHFVRQSGDMLIFDIDEIYLLGFAKDFTNIEDVKQGGKASIVYDATAHTVHVINVKDEGKIHIFTSEGKLAKSAKGTSVSVANLPNGLYIVSYNMELNAKIIKK
ncbi:MAG: hypothetical protein E7091_01570 [Bacteroidales bacterium]|nr:hypothetical protein [Bacteroidales bacterium]